LKRETHLHSELWDLLPSGPDGGGKQVIQQDYLWKGRGPTLEDG